MTEERGFLGIFFKSHPKEEKEEKSVPKSGRRRSSPSSGILQLMEENRSLKERLESLTESVREEPEPVEDEDDA